MKTIKAVVFEGKIVLYYYLGIILYILYILNCNIKFNCSYFLFISVIAKFLDTEQLLSVLVQIPKQDTVCIHVILLYIM